LVDLLTLDGRQGAVLVVVEDRPVLGDYVE
jgi:hypothetical protein